MMRIRPSLHSSYLVRLLGILVCALALHASASAQTRQAVAGTTVSLVALEAAAERLLKETKEFEAAQIETREQTAFAGSTGVLLTGTHAPRGTSKRFAQYMASNNGRYIRMIVSADPQAFAELRPTITAIAKSIAFKGPAAGKQVPLAGGLECSDDLVWLNSPRGHYRNLSTTIRLLPALSTVVYSIDC